MLNFYVFSFGTTQTFISTATWIGVIHGRLVGDGEDPDLPSAFYMMLKFDAMVQVVRIQICC